MADISVIIDVIGAKDMVGATKAADRMRKEYKQLDRQFNQGKINAQQYARGVQQIDARIDSLIMAQRQATSSSVAMHKNMANGGRIMNQYSDNINIATQKTKRFGAVGMQQVGYQVQDFAVQVQSGTNAMVALGQQGSQLLGIFGPAGAIGGMILAIGTGLAGAFMAAGNAAKSSTREFNKAEEALEQFNSISTRLDSNLATLALSLENAREEFGRFSEEVQEASRIAAQNEIRNLTKSLNDLELPNEALGDFEDILNSIQSTIQGTKVEPGLFINDQGQREALDALYSDLSELEEQTGVTTAQAVALQEALDFSETTGLAEASEQATEALRLLGSMKDESGDIPDALDPLIPVLQEIQQKTAGFVTTVEEGVEASNMLVSSTQRLSDIGNTAYKSIADFAAGVYENATELARTEERISQELQNQIDLRSMELLFGKESEELAIARAAQERKIFEEQRKAEGMTDDQVASAMELYDALQSINKAIEESTEETSNVSSGLDKVVERANAAARAAYGIFQNLRNAAMELSVTEAGIAAAQRVTARGGTESDARVVQAGAETETRLQQQGVSGPELQAQVAQAMANERRRLEAERAERQLFAGFDTSGGGSTGGGAAQAAQEVQKLNDALSETQVLMQDVGKTVSQSFGDALMSIVDGSKSAADAFKDMARQILKQAFDMLVVKPIMDSIMGFFGGNQISGPSFGLGSRANSAPPVRPFADGGVVSGAQMFSHSGGLGVMGEAGPEAIMPLKRGKNGKLGVQVEGGSGNVTVENHFHISANGDDSVKRIIQQEAPKIASYTQQQILDQRRRGGAMKQTFG